MAKKQEPNVRSRLGLMFRPKEWLGLFALFIGSTSIGLGLYWTIWLAVRPLYYRSIVFQVHGAEWLLFFIFYGIGGVLLAFGRIELRDAVPGWKTRAQIEAERVLRKIG